MPLFKNQLQNYSNQDDVVLALRTDIQINEMSESLYLWSLHFGQGNSMKKEHYFNKRSWGNLISTRKRIKFLHHIKILTTNRSHI